MTTQLNINALKLQALANQIVQATINEQDYSDLVQQAQEELQALFTEQFDDYEIQEHKPVELTVNLTELPEGHSYALYRPDQIDSLSTFGNLRLTSFVESYESVDAAYSAARAWEVRPVHVGAVIADDKGLQAKPLYIYSDKSDKDQA